MSLATMHANLRAAFRERLLTLTDIDHSPGVSVTLANGVFTRASGSWLTADFAPGMEVTVNGFTGSPLYGVVETVSASALKLGVSGSQTVAGGGQFVVGLPQGRAWEGFDFFPVDGRPYVAESFRTNGANSYLGDTATHMLEASLTLFYPKNKGTRAIEGMAGAAMAHFKRGTPLTYGGDGATINNVERTSLYDDGARIACAVTAKLFGFTQN